MLSVCRRVYLVTRNIQKDCFKFDLEIITVVIDVIIVLFGETVRLDHKFSVRFYEYRELFCESRFQTVRNIFASNSYYQYFLKFHCLSLR